MAGAAEEAPEEALRGCVFVGHANTDLDSVASAVAAAVLFEGTPARASEVLNGECVFALARFGVAPPRLFADLCREQKVARVCLVDHNQVTQLAEGVDVSQIVGIIDHHALQAATVETAQPILVDIRPWGSTCTIIAKRFAQQEADQQAQRAPLEPHVAGLLLAGILSDTLNLRSPTTRKVDSEMTTMLSAAAGLSSDDVASLVAGMFKAKGDALSGMSAHSIVLWDFKTFSLAREDAQGAGKHDSFWQVGFGVVETTQPSAMLARTEELLEELRALRKEMGLDFSLFAVVDSVNLQATLLLCGDAERALAGKAFPQEAGQKTSTMMMALPPTWVSRKLNFIPNIAAALKTWSPPAELLKQQSDRELTEDFGSVVVDHGSGCCAAPVRVRSGGGLRDVVKRVQQQKQRARKVSQIALTCALVIPLAAVTVWFAKRFTR